MGGKQDKRLKRLLSRPTDYEYRELLALLIGLGYRLSEGPGSSVHFIRGTEDGTISIHAPHKYKYFKDYFIKDIIDKLQENGDL